MMGRPPKFGREEGQAPYQPADGVLVAATAPEDPWNYEIDTAPQDGSEVALLLSLEGPDYRVCRWRRTKRVMGGKWHDIEGWSDAINRQMLMDLAPVAWARYDIIDGVKKAS